MIHRVTNANLLDAGEMKNWDMFSFLFELREGFGIGDILL